MATVIGTLPAGIKIQAVATYGARIVIATSDGVYFVQNGKLEKSRPFDAEICARRPVNTR